MSIEVGMQVKRRGRKSDVEIINEALKTLGTVDNSERIAHWAYRLELAANMKAGAMDSESRHMEVANTIKSIVLSVVEEMRQC